MVIARRQVTLDHRGLRKVQAVRGARIGIVIGGGNDVEAGVAQALAKAPSAAEEVDRRGP